MILLTFEVFENVLQNIKKGQLRNKGELSENLLCEFLSH